MDGLWQLAFALLAFAYLYRYSKTELETDKFYEDPPQIAPRVRIRRNRRSSASLNSHPRDDKIERVQERLLVGLSPCYIASVDVTDNCRLLDKQIPPLCP